MKTALIRHIAIENRLLLGATLAMLLCCGYLWYAVLHQKSIVSQQQRHWAELRRQAGSRDKQPGADLYLHEKEQIRKLRAAIPYRHEFPRVLSQILDLTALQGATPGRMEYTPAKTGLDGITAYEMKYTAVGGYAGLKRLIAELERLDGITTLNSFSFSKPDSELDSVTTELHMTIYLHENRQ